MTIISLASVRGAPGVTTTALGLALHWPRPVLLIEADMSASSAILAGYFGGQRANDRGLIDVAIGHRHGSLTKALQDAQIEIPGSQHARMIAGLAHAEQASALTGAWSAIATELRSLEGEGIDVIVDAGRVGAAYSPEALTNTSDVSLLVTRTTLPAVAAVASRGKVLKKATDNGQGPSSLGLLIVGDGQPIDARQIAELTEIPLVASVPSDPAAAAVLSDGTESNKRWSETALARSYWDATQAIQAHVTAKRAALDGNQVIVLPNEKPTSLRSAVAGLNKRINRGEKVKA